MYRQLATWKTWWMYHRGSRESAVRLLKSHKDHQLCAFLLCVVTQRIHGRCLWSRCGSDVPSSMQSGVLRLLATRDAVSLGTGRNRHLSRHMCSARLVAYERPPWNESEYHRWIATEHLSVRRAFSSFGRTYLHLVGIRKRMAGRHRHPHHLSSRSVCVS